MPTFELKIGDETALHWPTKCVVCGASANSFGIAKCSVVTKVSYVLIYLRYTSRIVTLRYPLCLRHRLLRYVPSLISRRSLFNLAIGFLVAFMFFFGTVMPLWAYLYEGVALAHPLLVLTWALVFAVGVVVFVLGRSLTPVMIHDAKDDTLKMSVTNLHYAEEFERANQDRIVSKDGYKVTR